MLRPIFVSLVFLFLNLFSFGQDSSQFFSWNVISKKIADHTYELIFSTKGNSNWNLYAPNQDLGGVVSASVTLNDSAYHLLDQFRETGTVKVQPSKFFTGNEKIYSGATAWTQQIKIDGTVPGSIQGSLVYNYGKGEEFYQGEYPFSVKLEGGVVQESKIKIASIDVRHPVNPCGDEDTGDKGLEVQSFSFIL